MLHALRLGPDIHTELDFMAGSASRKAYAAASEAAHQNDFDKLKPLSVIRAKNGETVPLVSVFQVGCSSTVLSATP